MKLKPAICFVVIFILLISLLLVFNNENLVVRASLVSSGCFHFEVSEIYVYEKDNKTLAILKIKGESEIETVLNQSQVASVQTFLKEFDSLKGECFSTTIDEYKVITNKTTISKTDGCLWNGFSKLKNSLFPESVSKNF